MPEGRRLAPEPEAKPKKAKRRRELSANPSEEAGAPERAEETPLFDDVTEPKSTARRERKREAEPSEKGRQAAKPQESVAKGYLKLLIRLAVLALAFWLLLTQVFQICQISGNAMFPAVKDGDLLFGYRLEHSYVQDDVVIYSHEGQRQVGRVAAVTGDVVNITEQGEVLVNGVNHAGDILYATEPGDTLTYPYTVPENSVFLLGDYRTQSADSRIYGAISTDEVESKVFTLMRRRGL